MTRRRRVSPIAFVLVLVGLLLPCSARADTGGAGEIISTPTVLAAIGSVTLTILVQEVRGYFTAVRDRAARADDQRFSVLDAQLAVAAGKLEKVEAVLAATREDYLKRTELDTRIGQVESRLGRVEERVEESNTLCAQNKITCDRIFEILQAQTPGVRHG